MKSESKPNIILIMTDQHRADYLGCYGHPVVQTPNIDSMAERGVKFDRFYVSSPVCMPNRATFMTGRMPSLHGVRMNGIPLSFRQVTFVEALADSGYRTALVGKSHLQNFTDSNPTMKRRKVFSNHRELPKELSEAQRENLDDPIYQQENPKSWTRDFSVDLPYYGFQHVELAPAHGDAAAGDHLRWMLAKDPNALNLVGRENQLHHDYICPQAVRTALPEELYSTNYVAERSVAYLEEHVKSSSSDPFFLNVSFPDPHHPFNPPGRYWGMYDPDDMETPTAFKESNWTPPPHVQSVMDERKSGKANLNGMTAINCNEREAREARALTCGMITCIDDAVGKILQKLKDLNLDDDTIVIFTADHGEHLGDHQLLFKGAAHYQSILRVPFIWSDPKASEQGRTIARIGSTLDIASTILDRAGVEPYNGIQGQSLIPEIENTSDIGPDESSALIQYEHQKPDEALGGPPVIHTLVTSKWRLSIFDGVDWGELYDLETDPEELRNVWDNPEYSAVKPELTEQLLRKEISYIEKSPLPTARA